MRIDQDGAGFGQRQAVVLDVARGGDGTGNQAAQRQGGAWFAVGAHGEAAAACRRVVRLAVEIEHMAPGLGERDTLRDVVTAVTAAADEGAAVGADQAVVEIAVGVVPTRIQEQALALGAIELPGSSLLPLRQREGRLGAQREAGQTRVGVGKHAPVAGAALARGQSQLVAASGEIEQSCDVAVGQVAGRQRRAHCIGAHQRRVVVVARDVQPQPRRVAQGEAQPLLVGCVLHAAADGTAEHQIGDAALGLLEIESLGRGQARVVTARAQRQAVDTALRGGKADRLVRVPPVAAEAAGEHLGATAVEHPHAVAAVVDRRGGGRKGVGAARLGREADHAGGQAIAERQIKAAAQRHRARRGKGGQGGAEAIIGAGRGVVVAALHPQRVAAGGQGPALRAAVGQHVHGAAVGVQQLVGFCRSAGADRVEAQLAGAVQVEAEVSRVIGLQETAADGVAERDGWGG